MLTTVVGTSDILVNKIKDCGPCGTDMLVGEVGIIHIMKVLNSLLLKSLGQSSAHFKGCMCV